MTPDDDYQRELNRVNENFAFWEGFQFACVLFLFFAAAILYFSWSFR